MSRAIFSCVAVAAVGCGPPDLSESMNVVDVQVLDLSGTRDRFVDAIDRAETRLAVALPRGEDTLLTDALIAAWGRGVEIEVVTDYDQASDEGIAALVAAGIPVTLADDGIAYFDFNINRDVAWTSDMTIMSHAFLIADDARVVWASSAGGSAEGDRIVVDLRGEDIVEDLRGEHNQVFGGADAVATTAFDNLAKSIADWRWSYPTQRDWILEMWFGPQERITKRVIDSIYAARSSIWVLTDDLANEGLAFALQEKASWGFDVKVVVGPAFGESSRTLSDVLLDTTPDVAKRQVTGRESVPTVVLVDYLEARDGQRHKAHAMALSHPLYAASRIGPGQREIINDQLIDGSLFVLDDWDAPSAELLALEDLFYAHWDEGEPL